MNTQIWTIITAIAMGLLVPITGALGIWGAAQVKRWQARGDLKMMRQNALDADAAIQQQYPNETGESKRRLAMEWAAYLNSVAGITTNPTASKIYNETGVAEIKKTRPPANAPAPGGIDPLQKGEG